jgi:hypothetical protein
MNEKIIKRIAALLSVKSLVTLVMTGVFAFLALKGIITGQDFMTVFLMVISFYFGTQSQKVQDAIDAKKEE